MTKPIPKVYATRFFQLVTTRQFAEAERILERVKQKMHVSDRNRGYFQALYGMLLTQRSNDDRYAFLSSIDLTNRKLLKSYRREFLSHTENRLHAEYDRGFFEAWADYMRILSKLEEATPSAVNKSVAEEPTETTVEAEAKIEEEATAQSESEEKQKVEQEIIVEAADGKETSEEQAQKRGEPSQSSLVDFAK